MRQKSWHLPSFSSLLVLSVISALVLCGCKSDGAKQYRIGVSQPSDDNWRDKLNEEIEREILLHDNLQVEILTADNDDEKQISDIRHFIDQNVDLIIAAPNQAKALSPILSEAYHKGIPVVLFDRGVYSQDYTAYIEFDNRNIGETAAKVASLYSNGNGKILEIRGLDDSTPAKLRHEGFASGVDSVKGMQIVASVDGWWNENRAFRLVDSLLAVYPDVNVIYAHNDPMAIGAAKAIKKSGKEGIKIIGTDASPEVGMKAVALGEIDATVMYPTDGQRLIRTALDILEGRKFKRNNILPANTVVNKEIAEILLEQNDLIKEETHKIEVLKDKNERLWKQKHLQSKLNYAMIAVAVLLLFSIAMLLYQSRQRGRFEKTLRQKNGELEREHLVQKQLYEKLEDATKSKLSFFTSVSHDLRTPLTLISEPVSHLAKAEYLKEDDRSMMRLADKNVKILRRLIDQILDFRKYETGNSDLHLEEVNLGNLIREWSSSFLNIAAKRDIRFTMQITDNDETLAIDRGKIERVFFNLLSNAFKHTPDNGEIALYSSVENGKYMFSVKDSGEGIPADELPRIFDKFYVAEQSAGTGFGIGLAVVKAFVDLHGGEISVESQYGKGSVFTVSLPIRHLSVNENVDNREANAGVSNPEAELEPIAPKEQSYDSSKELILAVDDNSDIRQLLRELLSEKYNVMTASGGKEAVKLAAKYVPDIILCDLMMPNMDGLQVLKYLKDEMTTSHIPVLMLTACNMEEQRVQSYRYGADGFISKPFDKELLIARISNLLENRKRSANQFGDGGAAKQNTREGADAVPELNDKLSAESEFYKKFKSVLQSHIGDSGLTIDTVAAELGIGAAQLARRIKSISNYSPSEILRSMRLKKAKSLLISTDKSISEVAYECGFSSPAYLSKTFRDAFGVTPSDYRNGKNDA